MNSLAVRTYRLLPVLLQNLACSYYGWREARTRFSPTFYEHLDSLLNSEYSSRDAIASFQDEAVRNLVAEAFESVPFYREVFGRLGLAPADIQTVGDLRILPVLTKEEVRANQRGMIAERAVPQSLIAGHTSGTTGTSLQFYRTPEAVAFQWAVWWRHRHRFGCKPGDLHVNFTGKPVVPLSQSRPPYWRYNHAQRQYLINMHHVTPAKIFALVEFLNSIRPRYYSGYPSILAEVARLALDAGLELRPEARPQVVFSGAENLQDYQADLLREWTGAVITDQYGFSEGAGNASRCEHGYYHEDFEFGVLECDPMQPVVPGKPVQGKILATGFANPAMPLIRYEIGDTATWAPKGFRCPCGRESHVILSIDGRVEDFVITPEGRRIMRFDYIFKDTQNIKEAQVVQRELGAIEIVAVKRPGFTSSDEQVLREEVARWISKELKVDFVYVESIPRERNGKFRPVKSFLPADAVDGRVTAESRH